MNVGLRKDQGKSIDAYIVAVANKLGHIPYAIKSKILRMAFDEWLTKHGKDTDINWDEQE